MKKIRSLHGPSTVPQVRVLLTVFQRLRLNSRNASVRQTRENGLTIHPCRSRIPRPVQIASKWSIVRLHWARSCFLITYASAKQSPYTNAETKNVAEAHNFVFPQYHPHRLPAL